MGLEYVSPNVWCKRCNRFTPRATTQDLVSPDGLRRIPVCLACRTELVKEQRSKDPTAEKLD